MYKGFLDKVVRRLIANITEHLTMIGFEIGLDGGDSVTNNFGSVNNLQMNQATDSSTINATQNIGIDEQALNKLIDAILSAAGTEIDDAETIEDVRDNAEIVRSQIESGKPKRGVLKSALGFLRVVNGGAQFAAAVVQLIQFVNNCGFQFPLPG